MLFSFGRIGLVIFSVLASQALAQDLPFLFDVPNSAAGSLRVLDVTDIGDVSGDDVPDLIMRWGLAGPSVTIAIDVVSGAGGGTLRSFSMAGNEFYQEFASAGDVTGDGIADVAFTRRTIMTASNSPLELVVQDGASGQEVWSTQLIAPDEMSLTRMIVRLGDLDGDGTNDLGVLTRRVFFVSSPGRSRVSIVSGATGSLIAEVFDDANLIDSIANAGDTNGDGIDDLIFGAPRSSFAQSEGGSAALMSGADFEFLRFWNGSDPDDHLGAGVAGAGDVNGDGFADLIITTPGDELLRLYSGVDNAVIATFPLGNIEVVESSIEASRPYDFNGDGVRDWTFVTSTGLAPSSARIRSGVDFSVLLATDAQVVNDLNGDLLPDLVSRPFSSMMATAFAHKGARTYGAGSGSLALTWEPNSSRPEAGSVVVSGGAPQASARVAVSAAPTNVTISGVAFPLWVSLLPEDLLLSFDVVLDAAGELRTPVLLTQPLLAGTVLYLQAAQFGPDAATSNGLEILFDL